MEESLYIVPQYFPHCVCHSRTFIYFQDQTEGDLEEYDDGCDIPPPNFQLVKTEVITDSELETDADVAPNDGLENAEASKNNSESVHFEDLIDATT
jgi:hypothetical protein